MDLSQLASYWPFITSFGGMLAGGLVTWTTTKVQIERLMDSHKDLDRRLSSLELGVEHDRVILADRLARVEVMLQDVRATLIRLESK
jgi:hypothetical protein